MPCAFVAIGTVERQYHNRTETAQSISIQGIQNGLPNSESSVGVVDGESIGTKSHGIRYGTLGRIAWETFDIVESFLLLIKGVIRAKCER